MLCTSDNPYFNLTEFTLLCLNIEIYRFVSKICQVMAGSMLLIAHVTIC